METDDDEDEVIDPLTVYKLSDSYGYELEGVSINEVKQRESGEIDANTADFQFIKVDSDTSKNLEQFGIREILKYAVKNEIFFRRRKIIEEVGLKDYELLIMILLGNSIWGLPSTPDQKRRANNIMKIKNTIHKEQKELNKFRELYTFLKEEHTYYHSIDPYGLIKNPEITLEKVSFTFKDKTNLTKERRTVIYKNQDKFSINPIVNIIIRYVELMKENSKSFYKDLGVEAYDKNQNELWLNRYFKKPHFLFCYSFIEFIRLKFNEMQIQVNDSQLFEIYVVLLKESGFTINTNKHIPYSEKTNIKKWYTEVKSKLKQE